jgi:hypothetical protein
MQRMNRKERNETNQNNYNKINSQRVNKITLNCTNKQGRRLAPNSGHNTGNGESQAMTQTKEILHPSRRAVFLWVMRALRCT